MICMLCKVIYNISILLGSKWYFAICVAYLLPIQYNLDASSLRHTTKWLLKCTIKSKSLLSPWQKAELFLYQMSSIIFSRTIGLILSKLRNEACMYVRKSKLVFICIMDHTFVHPFYSKNNQTVHNLSMNLKYLCVSCLFTLFLD